LIDIDIFPILVSSGRNQTTEIYKSPLWATTRKSTQFFCSKFWHRALEAISARSVCEKKVMFHEPQVYAFDQFRFRRLPQVGGAFSDYYFEKLAVVLVETYFFDAVNIVTYKPEPLSALVNLHEMKEMHLSPE